MIKRTIAAALATAALGLIPAAAQADDPHQTEVQARFYGTCTNWYVAYWGVDDNASDNAAQPAEADVAIRYHIVRSQQMMPGSYHELHRYGWKANGIPRLVQVFANGHLVADRLFSCGFYKKAIA